jgi:hypothetical protein
MQQHKEVVVVNQPANSTTTTTVTEKKGLEWSCKRSGGAGVGAVTGAIISKKKGESYNRWLQAQE